MSAAVAPDSWTFNANALSYTISGSVVNFSAGGIINNANAGQTISIANNIGEAVIGVSVKQNASSTLILSGTNNYSGGVSINAGTLQLGNISGAGTGTVTLNGGTLRSTVTGTLTNDVTFGDGSTAAITAAAGQTLTIAAPNFTFGSAAGANGHFGSATDTGTIVLGSTATTANTTSNIFVDGGTLRAANGSLTSITSVVSSTTVAAGATLDYNDQAAQVRNLQGAGTVRTGANAATTLELLGGTFSGGIQGAGNMRVLDSGGVGSGVVILSGAGLNTYAGTTTVDRGTTLRGGAANAFNAASATTVDGTLDLNSFNQTIGSLAGNGSVTLGSATLTFGGDNTSTLFGGTVSGTGGLTKVGNGGPFSSPGVNDYSGPTNVNGGALKVFGSIANSLVINVDTLSSSWRGAPIRMPRCP